jgi:cell wall-associated NlpC family hydrolase
MPVSTPCASAGDPAGTQAWRRAARALSLLIAAFSFAGCVSHQQPGVASHPPARVLPVDLEDRARLKEALYAQFSEWRGVPYRIGGASRDGVDCSGFVQLTYQSLLGIELPRSTDVQVNAGVPVSQHELLPGDLVFFRTGVGSRHVGIYLENRKFIHASSEKGVMISGLDDHYWSRRYWKAVRVAPLNRLQTAENRQ